MRGSVPPMARRVLHAGAVVVLTALSLSVAAPAAPARPLIDVTADRSVLGPRVPSSFLGFSQEYNLVPRYVGLPQTGVNEITAQLFRNLAVHNGPPNLRIGGGSTDGSWFNPEGRLPPPGMHLFNVNEAWTQGLRDFLARTGSKAIIGLNMGLNDPAVAVEWAQAATRTIPRSAIRALQIGNEPHVYPYRVLGKDARGRTVYTRPKTYGPRRYLRELRRFTKALRRAGVTAALAAPGVCCAPWLRTLPRIAARERAVKLLALHRYPLEACGRKRGDPDFPTAKLLLSGGPTLRAVNELAPAIAAMRRRGLPVRITESNSIACGGTDRVSNGFASALWGIDWLFTMAAIGAKGVDLHSSSPRYAPYTMPMRDGRVQAIVQPLYFAQLAFAETTRAGSRLLPSAYYPRQRRGGRVTSWATWDARARVVRVLIVNRETRRRGTAVVRIPGSTGPGRLKRLTAPSVHARTATWGGQTFALPSFDGKLVGSERLTRVRRRGRNRYIMRLPRASAAMITVPVGR